MLASASADMTSCRFEWTSNIPSLSHEKAADERGVQKNLNRQLLIPKEIGYFVVAKETKEI